MTRPRPLLYNLLLAAPQIDAAASVVRRHGSGRGRGASVRFRGDLTSRICRVMTRSAATLPSTCAAFSPLAGSSPTADAVDARFHRP